MAAGGTPLAEGHATSVQTRGTPRSKTQPNRPLRSESYGTMPRWTEMGSSADTRQLVEDSALPLLSWVSRTNFANAGWRAPRQLSPVYGRRSSRRSHGPSSWPSRSGQRTAAIHRHADSLLVEQVAEAQRDRQGQQRHHVTRARPHALVPRHLTVSGCVCRRRFNSTHGSFDSTLNRTSHLAKSAGKS